VTLEGLTSVKTCAEGPVNGGTCEQACDAAGYLGSVTFTCDSVTKEWTTTDTCTPGMVCVM